MFLIFKTIISIVFVVAFFIFGSNFFHFAPTTNNVEIIPQTEVKEVKEIKKESLSKPSVIKTEPLRVLKEKVPLSNSLLTVWGIISWTNFFRQTNSLSPLQENSELDSVASFKLLDMLSRQYFEHTSPTGEGAGDIAKKIGYKFVLLGENLAMGDFLDDQDVVKAWMDSPGHRANILKPAYTQIGVAAKKGIFNGREVWMSVQIFATPLSFCKSPDEGLLAKVDSNRAQLKSNKEQLDLLRNVIESQKYQTREEYEKLVAEYNSLVPSYNFLSQSTKSLIEEYNSAVASFNQCVGSIE